MHSVLKLIRGVGRNAPIEIRKQYDRLELSFLLYTREAKAYRNKP